jgi:probable HAF family extracellular repeat protein
MRIASFARPLQLRSLATAVVLTLLSSLASAEVRYEVLDIGTLNGGGGSAVPYGINDAGQIVGSSIDASGEQRAFLYDKKHGMKNLGLLPKVPHGTSTALSIDSVGGVTGISTGCQGVCEHGFYIPPDSSAMVDLGTSKRVDSRAVGSNRKGLIVGSSGSRALIWRGSNEYVHRHLGLPGYQTHQATSVNKSGAVAGYSEGAQGCSAWIWQAGVTQDISRPTDFCTQAAAINGLGAVTGTVASDNFSGLFAAFIWTPGSGIQLLPGLADQNIAAAINDRNEIVGTSSDGADPIPFAYSPDEGTRDLNTLIPPESGVTLNYPSGINNKGEIVASGKGPLGTSRAYLLTPVRH